MHARKTKELVALSTIPLIMTLGNSMLIPVLPAMRERLGVSAFQISLLITVYSLVAIVLIPIAGYLSDRFGRKQVILPSLVLTAIGGAICGVGAWFMAHPYGVILIGRFLQGIGAAGAAPIVMPLIGDLFKEEAEVSRGLGVIETSNTFGKVLSPLLGAWLASFVWYAPFLSIPLLCIASLLLVGFLVAAPKRTTEEKEKAAIGPFLRSVKAIFAEKGRWLYAIFAVGGICMFVVFAALFYLSEHLEARYQIHGVSKGGLLAIPLGLLCIASYLTGKWIGESKQRMKWAGFTGMALATAATLACGWTRSDTLIPLLGLIGVAGAGIGMALPSLDALITEGIEKAERGTVTSIYSSMRFAGVALGPPVASVLQASSRAALFYTIAGVCALAACFALWAIKPKEKAVTGLRLNKV